MKGNIIEAIGGKNVVEVTLKFSETLVTLKYGHCTTKTPASAQTINDAIRNLVKNQFFRKGEATSKISKKGKFKNYI